MTIGGSFNLQGHKNAITVERNTYVSTYTEGTNKNASYVNIYNGNNATGLDQNTNTSERVTKDGSLKTNNSEFAPGDSIASRIFEEVLKLDGNADTLTTKDLMSVNQSWLDKLFGKSGANVKLNSKYDNKSGTIDISYNVDGMSRHLYINAQTETESKNEQMGQIAQLNISRRNVIKQKQEKLYQDKLSEKFGDKYSVTIEVPTIVAIASASITVNQAMTLEQIRNDLKCDEKVIINNNPELKSKKVQVGGIIRKDYSYDKIEIPAGYSIKIPVGQIFKNEKSELEI